MKILMIEKIARIIKNKKKLEEKLGIKITNRGKEVNIQAIPENEYIAEKVIDALNFGFPFKIALLIKQEDFTFEIIKIKDYTKRHDLKRIRARIIGTKGKTFGTLTNLTRCHFELKENEIGIIGAPEHIKSAQEAVVSIIQGAKQSNVYAHLEKHQPKPITDLGLKEDKHKL